MEHAASHKSAGRLSSASNVVIAEEPKSKRVRITLSSHADFVQDENSSGAAAGVDIKKEMQESLEKGSRVIICGIGSRPELNGQAGQLLGYHPGHSRWLVSLDSGEKKLVSATNLQLEETSTASGVRTVAAPPEKEEEASAAPSVDTSSFLIGKIQQSLHRVQEVCGKTCAAVAQLRCTVHGCRTRHPQNFLQYCQMDKPRDSEEQSARNTVRGELQEVAQVILTSMQQLIHTSTEPAAALQAEEASVLQEIDGIIRSLTQLREETASTFTQYAEKLDVDRRSTDATIATLAADLGEVDKFVQCFSQEVQEENAEAERMHYELLEKLESKEATFVKVNDSPEMNLEFAAVRAEISEMKKGHEERVAKHASQMAFIASWDSMLSHLPTKSQQQVDAKPVKSFWRRFAYFSNAASSA